MGGRRGGRGGGEKKRGEGGREGRREEERGEEERDQWKDGSRTSQLELSPTSSWQVVSSFATSRGGGGGVIQHSDRLVDYALQIPLSSEPALRDLPHHTSSHLLKPTTPSPYQCEGDVSKCTRT